MPHPHTIPEPCPPGEGSSAAARIRMCCRHAFGTSAVRSKCADRSQSGYTLCAESSTHYSFSNGAKVHVVTNSGSISALNCLDVAWSNVGSGGVDLDLPDIIQYADIASQWEFLRYRILAQVENGQCYPTSVEIVDLPKDRLGVRPLARFDIEHRLHYESLIVALAPMIQKALSGAVYSHRWWERRKRLLSPVRSWIDMQHRARWHHEMNPKLSVTNTDISAFYEHIDVDILVDDLRRLKVPELQLTSLEQFLRSFNQLSSAWGIPQGSDMSGMLANLYLTSFDAEIRRGGFRHFRYSDDTYVFGEDWDSLRGVLVRANRTLRHRHLNLNSSKTKIYPSEDVLALIEDKEKDAISYGIRTFADWAPERLRDLFDQAIEQTPPNTRDIKFCLTNLANLLDYYAVKWLLSNFAQIPHIAREVLVYLDHFSKTTLGVEREVPQLLLNEELRHYPSARLHILAFMIRSNITSRRASDEIWRMLLDRNEETFVREMAARYLGLLGPPGEAGQLKQAYQLEANYRIRRALLVACYESNQCSKAWLGMVAASDDPLRLTTEYLQASPPQIPRPAAERPQWR